MVVRLRQPNLKMSSTLSAADWESMYAPYDQPTYQSVLEVLKPEDVVLDIGAGDLRFARQAAWLVEKVYAVESNAQVLYQAQASLEPLPDHLIPVCTDAQALDFPTDITVGVLLMRHCTHLRLYSEKLRMAGARRLITNVRWRMSVEEVNLWAERTSFHETEMGWYACLCGATGFKVGPAEQWSFEMDELIHEVADCPQCKQF
jgi:SAM-dependent methyltransferase